MHCLSKKVKSLTRFGDESLKRPVKNKEKRRFKMTWYQQASMPGLNTLPWPMEGWGWISLSFTQLMWDQQELCGVRPLIGAA